MGKISLLVRSMFPSFGWKRFSILVFWIFVFPVRQLFFLAVDIQMYLFSVYLKRYGKMYRIFADQ